MRESKTTLQKERPVIIPDGNNNAEIKVRLLNRYDYERFNAFILLGGWESRYKINGG